MTRVTTTAIIHHKIIHGEEMPSGYEIGQKVTITPVREQSVSRRDSDLHQYAGQIGKITNYYWIRPPIGEVFYLYTVRIDASQKEIVLYEDEMELVSNTRLSHRSLKHK
ncbi:hypothetical protein ACFLW4_00410 [Chloroflexota bacterium]